MSKNIRPIPEDGQDLKYISNDSWITDCQTVAKAIRRRVLSHTVKHGGYLSQACSSAEAFSYLYTKGMNLGPSKGPLLPTSFSGSPSTDNQEQKSGMLYNGERHPDKDRFFLSPTHYALTLYATLIETGRLGEKGLEQFNVDGSTVEMIGGEHSPGHETNGGSFGQTISQAAGVAWARKKKGDKGIVWIFLSDGECQEGQTWEAIMTMSFYQLNNIKIIVDANGQQVDGRTDEVMALRDLEAKFEAFGANTATIDGHDFKALHEAFTQPHRDKPLVVIANTEPYRGINLLKDRYPNLHYVRFKNDEEREIYIKALDNM